MRRKLLILLLIFAVVTLPLLLFVEVVHASSVSAADLIYWMNGLRMSNGYSAMIEDPLLTNSAASAAYAMYDIYQNTYTCGHPGGKMERIAATGYGGGSNFSATENIACATSADLAWFAQYNVWGDPEHQYPATNAQYTRVGAFAYSAPNGVTYYVMHAASGSGDESSPPDSSVSTDIPQPGDDVESTFFVVRFPTSTPDADGTIYHVVKSGESLYTIAVNYGVTVEKIQTLNNLTSTNIYVGNTLKISLLPTPTITPTRTPTTLPPTRTATATSLPATPRPTRTMTPTPQPSLSNLLPKIDRQWLGLGLLVLSAVGFFVVFYFSFLKSMRKK
jgi:LysM repeat protein